MEHGFDSSLAGFDAVIPAQYFNGRNDDGSMQPIKRLMMAVLEDALRCFQTYYNARTGPRRRLFVEAEAWLTDRRADGPFAFESICEALGIEPQYLRGGLRKWRRQQLAGLNPPSLSRRSPVVRAGRISSPLKRTRRVTAQAG